MKQLNYLLLKIEPLEIKGNIDITISSLCYDSRKAQPGSMFFALRGSNADGHNFISAAIHRGAGAVVCESVPPEFYDNSEVTFIVVQNSRSSLARLSHAFYDYPSNSMQVYGITGTNGKTTITYLLKSIFQKAGRKCGIIGTTGIFIDETMLPATDTTPESLELCEIFCKMKENSVQTVIMEVSSHALNQHRVDCIEFDGAIFTNLTHDHLDYHNSMKEYSEAKKILFEMLSENSIAVLNGDSEFSKSIAKDCKAGKIIFTGRNDDNDIIITKEKMTLNSSEFSLESSRELKIELPKIIKTELVGKFNIENAALSAVLAGFTGIHGNSIKEGLAATPGAPGRMQKVILKSGAIGIVDYAHTPDALEKALNACRKVLNEQEIKGRLICVFGCGGDRDVTKRPKMGNISASIADYTIITSDNPRTEDPDKIIQMIYSGLESSGKSKTVTISSRAEAIDYACRFSRKGDIILLAGKGHENYQIIGNEKIHFDDIEELKNFQITK